MKAKLNIVGFEVLTAASVKMAIALMIEAASTSEMLVNSYQTTRRYNSEYSHVHTLRRENRKFYLVNLYGEVTMSCVRK
jgi:hypothetical protein